LQHGEGVGSPPKEILISKGEFHASPRFPTEVTTTMVIKVEEMVESLVEGTILDLIPRQGSRSPEHSRARGRKRRGEDWEREVPLQVENLKAILREMPLS